MGRASKVGAHFGLLRAGPQPARVAASLRAPISRPMAAPAQTRSADLLGESIRHISGCYRKIEFVNVVARTKEHRLFLHRAKNDLVRESAPRLKWSVRVDAGGIIITNRCKDRRIANALSAYVQHPLARKSIPEKPARHPVSIKNLSEPRIPFRITFFQK